MTDQFPVSQRILDFLNSTGSRSVHRLVNKVNDAQYPITKQTPLNVTYMQFPQEIMKDTPVAFYRLNANANDSTTNVLHGTASAVTFNQASLLTYPQGGVPITSGSASFVSASSSNVLLPTNALLNLTGNVTLEVWIKTSQSVSSVIIGGYSASTGYGIVLNNVTAGKFGYTVRGNVYESTTSVNDNTRHQLAVVATTTTIKLYLDGQLHRTVSSTNGQPTSYSGARRLGSTAAGGSYFNGNMEEAAIFSSALTDADVLGHWQAGTAVQVAAQ